MYCQSITFSSAGPVWLKRVCRWGGILWLAMAGYVSAGILEVRFATGTTATPERILFDRKVLRTALEATRERYGDFRIVEDNTPMLPNRAAVELLRGTIVNVMSASVVGSNLPIDNKLIPVPIMKGLLGYRMMVVRKSDIPCLDQVRTIDDLKHWTIGQVQGWGDIAVYESNGLNVITGVSLKALFSMLAVGRFDLLPLGALEVKEAFAEFSMGHSQLDIYRDLVIYYPWPMYFRVTPTQPELAERLEQGLLLLKKNGTLDRLVQESFGETVDVITAAKTIVQLDNPFMPQALSHWESDFLSFSKPASKDADPPPASGCRSRER